MAAYLIAEVDVTDAAAYEEYRKRAPATIAQYGGKYLVRGGATESKEGGWTPARLVILEFPSMEQARRWYDSPEYTPVRAFRQRASRSRLIFAEGLG
ncbi:MAG TPA: DUF1330 domain-containing protein [Burkholderiales bacterium]|nr:DUF1330 domain-containing protein [Burkholderiales bacterium]